MPSSPVYTERLTSNRTTILFEGLALLFLVLLIWRRSSTGYGWLTTLFFCLFLFFLFYTLNYRTLRIHCTTKSLILRFGLIYWEIPVENIQSCSLDETSLRRIGGAGIHFSTFNGRYRALFNFLEYPRVVIALKKPRGPVWEIAFSTRQPEQLISLITAAITQEATA